MSSLSPETTQPELSGLGVTPASGVWPASGIYLASGLSVVVSGVSAVIASGSWLASGIIPNISGQAVSISGDVVSISGVYPPHGGAGGAMVQSGAYYGSGMFGPVGLLGIDLSGSLWNPIAVTTSGTNILQVGGTVSVASGHYPASGLWPASGIYLASGINVIAQQQVSGVVGVSGNVFVMSGLVGVLSGAISVVSGSVTINSGIVAVSGLFAGFSGAQKFLSGAAAVSGAQPVVPVMYDYSGAQWTPFSTAQSGATIPSVYVASGMSVTATTTISGLFAGFSGAQKFISGGGAVSGAIPVIPYIYDYSGAQWTPMSAMVSGGNDLVVKPSYKTATYSMSGLFSTAASSLTIIAQLLSSGRCNTVTIRNWSGNTPIFVDTGVNSGTTLGAGGGFVLYGGDGLTLDYGPNMNGVAVAAQVSGTLISHFASYY